MEQKHRVVVVGGGFGGIACVRSLKAKDVEVLYLVDPIDEYALQHVTEFDGKKLMSVSKEGLKFGDEDYQKKLEEYLSDEFKDLTTFLKEEFKDDVEKVC